MDKPLKINEIFYSIQGESLWVGKPTVFIRTTGCNLRCKWCDTQYSYYKGEHQTISSVLDEVKKHGTPYVCVTGGEPLLQENISELFNELLRKNYQVSLETGGGVSVKNVPNEVVKVLDIKCPDSLESDAMIWENLDYLNLGDQVKFVIAGDKDFEWAKQVVLKREIYSRATVLFSPVQGLMSASKLASKILEEKLPVTFQMQLHKVLWGNKPGV